MDPTATPGILGAFATAFLSLIGVVVWIIRQQLGQSQRLIDTIPTQINLFVGQMDKSAAQTERLATQYQEQLAKSHEDHRAAQTEDREFYAKQLDVIARAFSNAQKEMVAAVKALTDSTDRGYKSIDLQTAAIDRQTRAIDGNSPQAPPSSSGRFQAVPPQQHT